MPLIAFDTLKAQMKLVEAGVPQEQAHAYIEVLADVARVDLESIATKDFVEAKLLLLAARLGK
jgi:hypothetical protein